MKLFEVECSSKIDFIKPLENEFLVVYIGAETGLEAVEEAYEKYGRKYSNIRVLRELKESEEK